MSTHAPAAQRLLVATRNRGKLAELQALLAPLGLEVLSLDQVPPVPPVIEDGETFEANALKKARETAAATGLPVLADDSGLSVDALGGAPGVHSARYAGEPCDDAANNDKLLRALAGVPPEARSARFTAVLALAGGDALRERTFVGALEGTIAEAPRGRDGFGYDPLFVPAGHTRTLAELGIDAKTRISHRARAFAALRAFLDGRA